MTPNFGSLPVLSRIADYAAAGVDLLLLQLSPQAEEMARFARDVIAPWRAAVK